MRRHDDVFFAIRGLEADLYHRSVDDAVGHFLSIEDVPNLPKVLEVTKHRRAVITEQELKAIELAVIEMTYETLDQEHGDPNAGPWRHSDADREVSAAARFFVDVIKRTYVPWDCVECDETIEVNVAEWICAHRPRWLENKNVKEAVRRLKEE